eukprot:gnl/MRDRNA2_/MRDRNA2_28337_c0_seq1.p1 gnl/MRDRNA2_/MRDRNA2_28337_c0~~gnl/MRDRNA2_/MRDRNA2_28337_c0_seq1.p1  ORF type:complete len:278 (-),score=48.85 gnl/MRDRNA2_/MRDRNA2_28337_c0_seq1:384-1217(-)
MGTTIGGCSKCSNCNDSSAQGVSETNGCEIAHSQSVFADDEVLHETSAWESSSSFCQQDDPACTCDRINFAEMKWVSSVAGAVVVAVDVDDTLVHLVDTFREWFDALNGRPMFSDRLTYHKEIQNPHSLARRNFMEHSQFEKLPPVPGAVDGLKALRKAGCRLEAMTSRPESMRSVTEAMLDMWFPNMFAEVHMVGEILKGIVCKRNGVHVLVDDSILQLQDAIRFGIVCLLFDFEGTYNSTRGQPLPFGMVKLLSWDEVSQWIIENKEFLRANCSA